MLLLSDFKSALNAVIGVSVLELIIMVALQQGVNSPIHIMFLRDFQTHDNQTFDHIQ